MARALPRRSILAPALWNRGVQGGKHFITYHQREHSVTCQSRKLVGRRDVMPHTQMTSDIQPSIRIRRAYEPPSPLDGRRFLVDRLWPRGKTKKSLQLDGWIKDVAPS